MNKVKSGKTPSGHEYSTVKYPSGHKITTIRTGKNRESIKDTGLNSSQKYTKKTGTTPSGRLYTAYRQKGGKVKETTVEPPKTRSLFRKSTGIKVSPFDEIVHDNGKGVVRSSDRPRQTTDKGKFKALSKPKSKK